MKSSNDAGISAVRHAVAAANTFARWYFNGTAGFLRGLTVVNRVFTRLIAQAENGDGYAARSGL